MQKLLITMDRLALLRFYIGILQHVSW